MNDKVKVNNTITISAPYEEGNSMVQIFITVSESDYMIGYATKTINEHGVEGWQLSNAITTMMSMSIYTEFPSIEDLENLLTEWCRAHLCTLFSNAKERYDDKLKDAGAYDSRRGHMPTVGQRDDDPRALKADRDDSIRDAGGTVGGGEDND